jgi:hypothetical protein
VAGGQERGPTAGIATVGAVSVAVPVEFGAVVAGGGMDRGGKGTGMVEKRAKGTRRG